MEMILGIIVLTIPIRPKAILSVFFKSAGTSITMDVKYVMCLFIDGWEIERKAVFHKRISLLRNFYYELIYSLAFVCFLHTQIYVIQIYNHTQKTRTSFGKS